MASGLIRTVFTEAKTFINEKTIFFPNAASFFSKENMVSHDGNTKLDLCNATYRFSIPASRAIVITFGKFTRIPDNMIITFFNDLACTNVVRQYLGGNSDSPTRGSFLSVLDPLVVLNDTVYVKICSSSAGRVLASYCFAYFSAM